MHASTQRAVGIAASVGALAIFCAMLIGGAGGSAAAPARCVEEARVIAVRGSGEPDNGGPGKTVGPFVKQLEAQGDPGSVNGEGLDYPAVPISWTDAFRVRAEMIDYQRSVDKGVANLVDVVRARAKRCGSVKLVLAGYSQGAQVIHEALPKLKPLAGHVGAVVLFGDPLFDPHSRAAVPGSFSMKRHGILGLPDHDFPAAFPRVLSFCRGGDLICQGFPNTTTAHKHYHPQNTEAAARKVAEWLGLRRGRPCAPAKSVAAILDDSGSMEINDPLNIRVAAMQLLISEPGGADRTLGAVEFGTEAGSLFDPEPVSQGQAKMFDALKWLADDGYAGTGTDTNYNAAFGASAAVQPGADARIFLTDGEHNVGDYEDLHRGGPRTYVVGLNIGRSGEGDASADLLGRIAAETGGAYYPLKQSPDDDPSLQTRRLQPVFNSIDAELECQIAPTQAVRTVSSVGTPAKPVSGGFLGNPGVQVVVSWTSPGADVNVVGASVRNPNGGLIANLTGSAPKKAGRHRKRRRVAKLATSTVSGGTFRTVTIARPKHGSTVSVRVAAGQLAEPTVVTVQVSPVEDLPTVAPAGAVVTPTPTTPPQGGGSPPGGGGGQPQTTWAEQETPNHPVNTFTNYHNASGMGPPIAAGQWVEVSCRVYDPTIASVNPDGYWYRIASSPWSNAYYAPANTFMNGDPVGGPYTHNTDFAVPLC